MVPFAHHLHTLPPTLTPPHAQVAELARVDMEQARGLAAKMGVPPSFLDALPATPASGAAGTGLPHSDLYLPLALPLGQVTLVDTRWGGGAQAEVQGGTVEVQ